LRDPRFDAGGIAVVSVFDRLGSIYSLAKGTVSRRYDAWFYFPRCYFAPFKFLKAGNADWNSSRSRKPISRSCAFFRNKASILEVADKFEWGRDRGRMVRRFSLQSIDRSARFRKSKPKRPALSNLRSYLKVLLI
jgi:hypothetical protein